LFESILMQVANPDIVTTITTLIISIAGIATAVGAVVHSLSMRPELKAHKKALQSAADFMQDVGTHVVQSKDDIATLARVTYDMAPAEAQKIVNAQNVRLAELNNKLTTAKQEISKIPGALDHI